MDSSVTVEYCVMVLEEARRGRSSVRSMVERILNLAMLVRRCGF